MSWSPDLFIGEFRPWPDSVYVVRGKTDDMRRYVPEEERDMYRDLVDCMVHPDVSDQLYAENVELQDENARLRSCLSDDAENARMIMAENEKLRELVRALYMCSEFLCGRCKYGHGNTCDFDAENELRELGIEVDDA